MPRYGKVVELSLSLQRTVAVREAMADIRLIESTGVDRAAVDGIRDRLIAVSGGQRIVLREVIFQYLKTI